MADRATPGSNRRPGRGLRGDLGPSSITEGVRGVRFFRDQVAGLPIPSPPHPHQSMTRNKVRVTNCAPGQQATAKTGKHSKGLNAKGAGRGFVFQSHSMSCRMIEMSMLK